MRRITALVVIVGLAASGSALATAPAATTGPTSAVGARSATVTGTVLPAGEATSWYVDYGTSTAYGSKTSSKSAGNGTSAVDVSAQLTGLQTGVTYHYRLVATNVDGVTHGADATFKTVAAPDATTTGASGIGPSHAYLSGTVDPNGLPTSWYAEYGTSSSYGSRTPSQSAGSGSSSTGVSVNVDGLKAGVTYHFRIVATNDAGTDQGGDKTFKTDSAPSVSTGSASSIGPTGARVRGSVDPNGRGSVAWFEVGTTNGYGLRTPERSVGGGTSSITFEESLSGLQPGTTYHYRIAGRSDAGTTYGNDRTFKTTAGPTVVTGPAAEISGTSASATGSVNPNGRGTSWWFEYGTTTQYGATTPRSPAGSGRSTVQVQARLTSLPANTDIHYRLVADSSGGRVYGSDIAFRTSGPPTVTTGVVTELGITRATVNGAVNPVGSSTTWWIELGRTTSLGTRIGGGSLNGGSTAVAVSQRLTALTPGVRWYFRVVAENAGGRSLGATKSFATVPVVRDPNGSRVYCTIVGTVSPDVLRGSPGRDVICGLGGNDRIAGLGGNDVVYGGAGFDRIEGGAGSDTLDGGDGRDLIFGGPGADVLRGGNGNDELLGGSGRDHVLGGGGADAIAVRDGERDKADGGPGPDSGALDLIDRRISIEHRLG